jgi:hypothetical protein
MDMVYPSDFQASLDKLKAGRKFRLSQEIKRLTDAERTGLISAFHPDYRSEGMNPLRLGANREAAGAGGVWPGRGVLQPF